MKTFGLILLVVGVIFIGATTYIFNDDIESIRANSDPSNESRSEFMYRHARETQLEEEYTNDLKTGFLYMILPGLGVYGLGRLIENTSRRDAGRVS